MTEKRQTWQGYIIRILQHFATKLRNIILLHVSVEVELIYSDRHNWKEIKRNISLQVDIHPYNHDKDWSFSEQCTYYLMNKILIQTSLDNNFITAWKSITKLDNSSYRLVFDPDKKNEIYHYSLKEHH
jgi:hypothetical protein